MPGHEFEKNVQQKLDELKIRPSGAVWKNVEKNIREEKRRRRMILWLPLLFLLLGGTGYILISKKGFVSTEMAIKINQDSKNKISDPLAKSKKENHSSNTQEQKQEEINTIELNQKDSKNDPVPNNLANQQTNSIARTKSSNASEKKTSTKVIVASNTTKKDQISSSISPAPNDETTGKSVFGLSEEEEAMKYARVNQSLIKESMVVVNMSIPEHYDGELQTPQVDIKNLTPSNANQIYRNSGWQWGLDFSLGTSSASSEIGFPKSAQMDNVSRVGVGGLNSQTPYSAVSIEPGMYWSAGGFVQRNFTNHFALSAGLQYSQYSTQTITSTRMDSTRLLYGNNFAIADRSGKANEYTNKYNYLELPVIAHFRLNKSNNFPVFANAGLSFGWLLNANSLNFDGTANAFSQDRVHFNKTQIGFHGGLTLGALNKSKHPLRIGPSMRYNFTGLMENSSSNRHLVSFGVDVRLLLKK